VGLNYLHWNFSRHVWRCYQIRIQKCYQAIERMGDWEEKFAYVVCHPGK
jgi:hypothetical protein